MTTIRLTDSLGLKLDGSLREDAPLRTLLPSFARLAELRLNDLPAADATAGLSFSEPVPIAASDLDLTVQAGATGTLAIIRPRQRAIDEDDPFGEIAVAEEEIYLALGLMVVIGGDLSGAVGPSLLGFSPSREFEMRCYRRFEAGTDGFPTFGRAFAATAESFVLPRHLEDLANLQADTVLVLRGSGTLTLSAGLSVSPLVEPLASVSLSGKSRFEVKAGSSFTVDASVSLTGGYQVRLRRVGERKTELGVYAVRSRAAELAVSAGIGVTAQLGGFDLGEKLIGALSRQPVVDREEFRRALPGEDDAAKEARIDGFAASLEAAVSTKLQASVKAAIASLHSREAAWVFEIDSGTAATDEARTAVAQAFVGRFDALTRQPGELPAGIAQTRNVLTDSESHKVTLKINLLGLVNLISVARIAQVTTIERNAAGDVTLIVDTSSARRMKALLAMFGRDGKRLRKLLSENFLIEASYRARDVGVLSPEFTAKHTYFEIDGDTSREDMKNNLDVLRVLGLLTPAEEDEYLGREKRFGRTEFYADTGYTSAAVRAAFLGPAGKPRPELEYERAGRSALGALLLGDEDQELRRRVAEDDALWRRMKEVGAVKSFPQLFGLSAATVDPRVEAAGSDFIVIVSWAKAMAGAADAIQQADALLRDGPVEPGEPKLAAARELLKRKLTEVVKTTREEFGDPLGMVMFFLAADRSASRTAIITGDRVSPLERRSVG
jgi:hypothetical protein